MAQMQNVEQTRQHQDHEYKGLSLPSVGNSSASAPVEHSNSNSIAQNNAQIVSQQHLQSQARLQHDDLILPRAPATMKSAESSLDEGKSTSAVSGHSEPIHVSTVWQEAKNGPFKRAFQFIAKVLGSLFGLSKSPDRS